MWRPWLDLGQAVWPRRPGKNKPELGIQEKGIARSLQQQMADVGEEGDQEQPGRKDLVLKYTKSGRSVISAKQMSETWRPLEGQSVCYPYGVCLPHRRTNLPLFGLLEHSGVPTTPSVHSRGMPLAAPGPHIDGECENSSAGGLKGTTGKNQSKAIKSLPGVIGTGARLIGYALGWETLADWPCNTPRKPAASSQIRLPMHSTPKPHLTERLLQTGNQRLVTHFPSGSAGAWFTHL
ncbi:hypothetical protein P7K49_015489 [Saguinus oedipus]|uniref:Uncharacterized protein n=1 Tax=Saguinus oedipus TaxID=9490 RepID=A0ABQ9VA79_SAGOE|nr:hypothetical protein P7K49_015489 [Saguinus oedipus]